MRIERIEQDLLKIRRLTNDLINAQSKVEEAFEELELKIEETEIDYTFIVKWFSSPHITDYDKRFVLEQFKHLLNE